MEDKKPDQPQGDGASPQQGSRSLDQLGTHGGPGSGAPGQPSRPPQSRPPSRPPPSRPPESKPPQSRPPPQQSGAGEEAGAGEEVMGTARSGGEGMQASDEDEAEGLAARAISRVKSIARGIMEKVPGSDEHRGPVPEEEENKERAEIAQAKSSERTVAR